MPIQTKGDDELARYEHMIQHMVNHKKKENAAKRKSSSLSWPQLSLIGIGSIIGAGFFLGTGLSIKLAGPSIILGYLIGGIIAFFTFTALAEMTVHDPQEGSFRTYAKKAYGNGFGFVCGWIYWFSGLLIMSSEITALSTFTQYWLPHFPLWIFSAFYALLGVGVLLLGVDDFGKIESVFALVKLSTLVIIIILGGLLIAGVRPGHFADVPIHSPLHAGFFPNGFMGFWTGLIFVLFSFGGIAVVGITSKELRNKEDVPKAGSTLIITLISVYILSLTVVLSLAKWQDITDQQSPFVTALSVLHIPFLSTIFNSVIISAAFSTMVGAFYSITNILVSLAKDHAAPSIISHRSRKGVPIYALLFTIVVLTITILLAYLLPKSVYEYLTTAAGVMLLLNWIIIIISELRNRKTYTSGNHFKMPLHPYSNFLTIGLILLAIAGALFQSKELIGVIVAICIVLIVSIIYWLTRRFRKETLPSK